MKYLASIVFLLIINSFYPQNTEWMNMDKELIHGFVNIPKDSIQLIEKYFESRSNVNFSDLGFGWKGKSVYKAGGYISITAELFYFNDSLVSYQISGYLPGLDNEVEKLKSEYLQWYDDYFPSDDKGELLPYAYKPEILYSPLHCIDNSLKNIKLNETLLPIMKPIPDQFYYWRGGFYGRISPSRLYFMERSDSLNYEELAFLTYSKNPATRFLAIEELKRRKYLKTKCSAQELAWIEKCFDEVPTIKTLRGCLGGSEKSKKLVSRFSKMTSQQLYNKF